MEKLENVKTIEQNAIVKDRTGEKGKATLATAGKQCYTQEPNIAYQQRQVLLTIII